VEKRVSLNKGNEKNKELLICLLIVNFLILFTAKVFTIVLVSPDDVAFQEIMSGITTGTPSGHCYFIRYPLAVALAFLYKYVGSIAWYQLFLYGSLVWCVFLILARVHVLHRHKRVHYLILAVLTTLMIFTMHLIHLEWTVTSGLLGATALFRYITMPSYENAHSKLREYLICLVLFLLCFCLRSSVAYMLMPLAGLCWIKRFLEVKNQKNLNKKNMYDILLFPIMCIISVAVIMLIHTVAYSSDNWKLYEEYTKDRAVLFDYYGYPDYDIYRDEYMTAGISRETYELMSADYNFVIPCNNFEDIDLKAIASLSKRIYCDNSIGDRFINMIQIIFELITEAKYRIINLLIMVLIFLNCLFCKGDRSNKVLNIIFVGLIVLWSIAISGYLAFEGRIPERVVRCIDYAMIAVLFGNIFKYKEKDLEEVSAKKSIINWIPSLVLVVAVIMSFTTLYQENIRTAQLARSKRQLSLYCKDNPKNIYFRDFWSFSQRGELFMQQEQIADNYLGIGGWTYNSPIYDKLLENHNCSDLYNKLEESDNIFYLVSMSRMDDVRERLDAYFISIGKDIRVEIAETFSTETEGVVVLQFKNISE
jgi:hypothetical protein